MKNFFISKLQNNIKLLIRILKEYCTVSIYLLINGLIFFSWLKYMQLNIAHPNLYKYYPVNYFIPVWIVGFLFFLALWLFITYVIYFVSLKKDFKSIAYYVSISFFSFLAGPLATLCSNHFNSTFLSTHHPVQIAAWLFFSSNIIICSIFISKKWITKHLYDIFVLLLIIIIIALAVPSLSPFYPNHIKGWLQEWDGIHGNGQFLLTSASHYSLPLIDQSYALGGYPVPINANFSYLIGIISLITGTSALDVIGRLLLYKYLFFAIVVWGSYSFYIYVRYSLSLSFFASLYGGLFYFLSNLVLYHQLDFYSVGFWSSYFMLPFVLHLLTLSARKKKLIYSALAGFCFSSFLYLVYPHPDNFAMSFKWLILPYAFIIIFCNKQKLIHRFLSFTTFLITLGLGFSLWILPYIDALFKGEQILIGYKKFAGVVWSGSNLFSILCSLFIFDFDLPKMPISFQHTTNVVFLGYSFIFIIYFYINFFTDYKRKKSNKLPSIIKNFWALITIITLYIILFGDLSIVHFILKFFHLGYIRAFYRYAPILYICSLTVSVFAIDRLLKDQSSKIQISIFLYFIILLILFCICQYFDRLGNVSFLGNTPILTASITAIFSVVIVFSIILLKKYPNRYVKILFLITILMIIKGIHKESLYPSKFPPKYLSIKSVMANYKTVAHDQRSYSYVRSKISKLKQELKTKQRAGYLDKMNNNFKQIIFSLESAFAKYADMFHNKESVLNFATKYATLIDSFYQIFYTNEARQSPIARFNNLVFTKDHQVEYWTRFPQKAFPISTFLNLNFVNWFGSHNIVKTANRTDRKSTRLNSSHYS